MKKIYKTMTVAALLLGSIGSANAISEKYFAQLDADKNGTINITEFEVNLQKYFEKKNITDPEVQAKKLKNGFKKKDLNGDGEISIEEWNTKPQK
ncbi:EF-hand domain-containing protein [Thalassotalea crassostreae]|uniref:EF-hand domain-containing protein n=1 Tax=Thalassotalea crassostreae TaxID=1763536 RepID=UPI000839A1BC|nr:EF-hand domain-containing protein [Thalassotalea crassostreae]